METYTFGNSQAAKNLIGNILTMPEHVGYARKVARLLDKQFKTLTAVAGITDRTIREATLQIWHKRFGSLLDGLPEIVRTHVLCVENGKYRQLLASSKAERYEGKDQG